MVHAFSLTGHVNHIEARIAASTWQDVRCFCRELCSPCYFLVGCMTNELHSTTMVSCVTEVFSRSQSAFVINSVSLELSESSFLRHLPQTSKHTLSLE